MPVCGSHALAGSQQGIVVRPFAPRIAPPRWVRPARRSCSPWAMYGRGGLCCSRYRLKSADRTPCQATLTRAAVTRKMPSLGCGDATSLDTWRPLWQYTIAQCTQRLPVGRLRPQQSGHLLAGVLPPTLDGQVGQQRAADRNSSPRPAGRPSSPGRDNARAAPVARQVPGKMAVARVHRKPAHGRTPYVRQRAAVVRLPERAV